MPVFDNKTYCEVCFLEHPIEDCIAVNVLQHLLYYGVVKHRNYSVNNNTYSIVGGRFYLLNGRISSYGSKIEQQEFPCGFKFLKFCSGAMEFMNTYAGTDWIKAPMRDRGVVGHDWMLKRFPHMLEKVGGEFLIEKAFDLAASKSEALRSRQKVNVELFERI